MAVIKAGDGVAFDMRNIDVSTLGDIVQATPTNVRVAINADSYYDFGGSFSFANGALKSGTITGITSVVDGGTAFTVTDVSLDAVKLLAEIKSGDTIATLALVLDGADLITGGSKADGLAGGDGNDTLTGLDGNDTLLGFDDNDYLDGGKNADYMNGGKGNDYYVVSSTKDVVSEGAIPGAPEAGTGGGDDTVESAISYKLGAGLENLILSGDKDLDGTGNAAKNEITGNSGDNRLDGGEGRDTLTGGQGDDVYLIDQKFDRVIELSGEGHDAAKASVSGYTLAANVEDLYLTGKAVSGTGNELANRIEGNELGNNLHGGIGNDTLAGGAGDDKLYGEDGADKMAGGKGDDTYFVDSKSDVVLELSKQGLDEVHATIDYKLGKNVENLILEGTADIDGKGTKGENVITGNDGANLLSGLGGNDALGGGLGADTLVGGEGKDKYRGGAGDDHFVFADGDFSGHTIGSADLIADFTSGDKIDLVGVDAVAGGGHNSFTFIGTNAFTVSDTPVGEIQVDYRADKTMIYLEVNGDGVADYAIRLDGAHAPGSISASDFILA